MSSVVRERAQRNAVAAGKFYAASQFEFHQRDANVARRSLCRPRQFVERYRRGAEERDDSVALFGLIDDDTDPSASVVEFVAVPGRRIDPEKRLFFRERLPRVPPPPPPRGKIPPTPPPRPPPPPPHPTPSSPHPP